MRLLGTGRLADVVSDLLPGSGLVIVAGDNKLAQVLAAREREIAIAVEDGRAARSELRALRFDDGGRLDLDSGAAAGAVIAGAARDSAGPDRLPELIRVVGDGVVVLLDKVARVEASRRALLAGISRLEQRVVSRTVVTAGVVTTWSRRSESPARM